MIDSGGCGGGPGRQPPRLGDEKVRADQGDQPDDGQKDEAHAARPPRWILGPPHGAPPEFAKQKVGNANRGEYITAFSLRKQLLASIFFRRNFFPEGTARYLRATLQTRIDEIFCFE